MKDTPNWALSNLLRTATPSQPSFVRGRLKGRTFALSHFDGEQLPSTLVDDDFPQDTQGVNKEGIVQLLGRVKAPLSWTWNI